MTRVIDLVVLDVHGVVLNNPFRTFLRELAHRTAQGSVSVQDRWERELRLPAWTGTIGDEELWSRLVGPRGARTGVDWRGELESRYALGPAAPHLDRWRARVPLWLLSNHRTHWLRPRLERFGLASKFDRVLVSDALGVAKPDPRGFQALLDSQPDPQRVLFVDDQARNVRAARELGLRALHLTPDLAALAEVDRLLGSPRLVQPDQSTLFAS